MRSVDQRRQMAEMGAELLSQWKQDGVRKKDGIRAIALRAGVSVEMAGRCLGGSRSHARMWAVLRELTGRSAEDGGARKERRCLRCERYFWSWGAGNRLCGVCRARE